MKAVILVAGVSRRLYPHSRHVPKCLLQVGPRTILDHQLTALRAAGVRQVVLVVGYRREQIIEYATREYPDFEFTWVINHHFFETNTAYSLWLACPQCLDGDFLFMNGDVIYPPALLARLLASPHPNALAVEVKPCTSEEVKVITDPRGRIMDIGKDLDWDSSLGEFIGVARFSAALTQPFFQALDLTVSQGLASAFFELALQRIAQEVDLHMVDVTDLPCIEVDFPEDLALAQEKVKGW